MSCAKLMNVYIFIRIICCACPCGFYFNNLDLQHGECNVKQHLNSQRHLGKASNPNKRKSTENLSTLCTPAKAVATDFLMRLTLAFMFADIPLEKLKNDVFRDFLIDFTGQNIPTPTTLRQNYVPKIYEQTLNKVRQALG